MRAQVKGFLTGLVMALTLGTAVTVIAQSWTAPRTWTDGETVTAAMLNTHIRDNATVLRAGGIAIASQAANEIIYATSATQLGRSSNLKFDGTTLEVSSSSALTNLAKLTSSGANSNVFLVLDNDADSWNVGIDGSVSDDFYIYNNANATKRLSITPAGVMTITGRVNSASAQPGFLAYNSADDTGAQSGTIEFDTEVYDTANNFNNTTDTFTAPVAGIYEFCWNVKFGGIFGGAGGSDITLVTSVGPDFQQTVVTTSDSQSWLFTGCVPLSLSASETVHMTYSKGASGTPINGASGTLVTWLSGRLLP